MKGVFKYIKGKVCYYLWVHHHKLYCWILALKQRCYCLQGHRSRNTLLLLVVLVIYLLFVRGYPQDLKLMQLSLPSLEIVLPKE